MARGETFTEGGVVYRDNGDGTATVVGYEDGQQPPRDPAFEYKGPKARTDIDNTQASTNKTTADTITENATRPAVVAKGQREAATAGLPQGYMWGPDGRTAVPIPGWKPPAAEENKQAQKNANLDALVKQINRVQQLYNDGLRDEPMGFLSSLAEFNPWSGENKQFNAASSGLAEQGLAAFRVPGVGAQSDTELRQFVEANKPSASNYDTEIEEKLLQLRSRVDATRQALGLAPAQWAGLPKRKRDDNTSPPDLPASGTNGGGGPTSWDNLFQRGEPTIGGGFGMSERNVPLPPEAQQEYTNYFANAIAGGGYLNPSDFANFYSGLLKKYAGDGYTAAPDPSIYEAYANSYNEHLKGVRAQTGGVGGDIPAPGGYTVPMNMAEQVRHNAALAGAPAIGAANAVSLGGVETLAPEAMATLRSHDNPYVKYGELGGEVAGTIYGANKTGTLASALVKRALPARLALRALRGGGKLGQVGRNLGTDMTYGAGYGAVTEGDPVTGAVLAGTGSALGQGAGKVIGTAVGGVPVGAAVRRLRDANIPLTVGQTLGGTAKAVEDRMMSIPGVGDLLRNRRVEGMRGFNQTAFGEAGRPIGASVSDTGETGLAELLGNPSNPLDHGAIGRAYESATAGVRVPLDSQMATDLRAVAQQAGGLPDDLRAKVALALQNRVRPALDSGEMTGEAYQQAVRGLKGYRAETPKAGFEEDYRNVLRSAEDALTGQMKRGGGPSVVEGLGRANEAYRMTKTLRDALDRGVGGTQSGEVGLFTPNQLQNAIKATGKKFPGSSPLKELADSGQSVLPSRIPDSGTAGRMAQIALPGLLAGGASAGQFSDNPTVQAASGVSQSTLAAAIALAALSTRRGQKAVNTALTRRGPKAEKLGRAIRRASPLFGSGAIPLLAGQ